MYIAQIKQLHNTPQIQYGDSDGSPNKINNSFLDSFFEHEQRLNQKTLQIKQLQDQSKNVLASAR